MKIVLLGLPKSGTTVMFYKLKQALHVPDRWCSFEPQNVQEIGDRTLTKAMMLPQYCANLVEPLQAWDLKLLLVRHPYDRIVSKFHYYLKLNPDKKREKALRAKTSDPRIPLADVLEHYPYQWWEGTVNEYSYAQDFDDTDWQVIRYEEQRLDHIDCYNHPQVKRQAGKDYKFFNKQDKEYLKPIINKFCNRYHYEKI